MNQPSSESFKETIGMSKVLSQYIFSQNDELIELSEEWSGVKNIKKWDNGIAKICKFYDDEI